MSRLRSWLVLIAVLAFAALIVGLPAGQAPLSDPNEARYTLLARDILEHGRWLVPELPDGWAAARRLRPWLGLGVLAVVLLPWYGTYLTSHTSAFVTDTVVGHYGSWIFRPGLLMRLEGLWLLVYALPWTIFVIGAIAWRRRAPDPERRLIAVWTLAIWALIGLSGIHRARYLFPIYPGLALLAGESMARAGQYGGARELRAAAYCFAVLAAAAAALGLSPLARRIGGEWRPWIPDTADELGVTAALLVATAVLAAGAAPRAAFVATGVMVALGVGAVLIVEGVCYPARFAREFDVRPIAAAARARTSAGVAVPAHPDIWLTYDFYLRRPVAELDRPAVERLLASEPSGALIMSSKAWSNLQRRAHPSWRVVAARRVASREIVVLGGGGA